MATLLHLPAKHVYTRQNRKSSILENLIAQIYVMRKLSTHKITTGKLAINTPENSL